MMSVQFEILIVEARRGSRMSLTRILLGGLIILVGSGIGWAATVPVDEAHTLLVNQAHPSCSDSTCSPCCTIQGAVYFAFPDDVISVEPGTYAEQVDFRDMALVGDITLEALYGPGTVLVAPTTGHTLRHGDSYTNTVTIDGVDFSSATGSACVYIDHQGDVVLTDVTANNCGYTAFVLDNTGSVTMERCTGNNSERIGIAIDGAASASLTDCTGSSNADSGIVVYTTGNLDLVNPTAVGNTYDGISLVAVAPATVTDATVTDNDRDGIYVATSSTVTISNSTVSGSWAQGIDIEWYNSDPVDGVTLTNVGVIDNGIDGVESGVRLREVTGPVLVTNCTFDNNGEDGFLSENSVLGDLEIFGGHANGNGDDGYDLRVTGNATVIGATANNNDETGFVVEMPGTIFFQDCVANDNIDGSGFDLQWQDPDYLDGASVIDCTAHNNGLTGGGGNGIRVKHVVGPVTVVGARTNGNNRTGVRVDDTAGSVLVRRAESNFGLEEGFKIDADVGPVMVVDCVADGNVDEGLLINRETVDVESVSIRRNIFVNNGATGVDLPGLGGAGPFVARCNDIEGNAYGLYLDGPVTVDARNVWWGSPSGPGPIGSGDGVYAEPGGTILHQPWLSQSFTSSHSKCEFFGSGFETGLSEEWDVVVE